MKCAIPQDWKTFETQDPITYLPIPPQNYDRIKEQQGLSQKVYKSEDVTLIHNKYMKWRQELGTDFCQGIFEFGKLHKQIYSLTNITKLRSFQYRLLQRGLVTNINLHKWKLIDNPKCTFCGEETETMTHLFYTCTKVWEIWNQIKQFTSQRFNVCMTLDLTSIILNQVDKNKNLIANFFCLLFKHYAYVQRCLAQDIHFVAFKKVINKMECIEKYNAVRNDRLLYHYNKWGGAQRT